MLTPYYQDDAVTLYNGDCREVLPQLGPVDDVVTDPPYCSGGFSESGKQTAKGMGLRSETINDIGWFVNDSMSTAGICWLMSHVSGWCNRILPPGGTLTAFTDWRMVAHLSPAIESGGFRYTNLLVWKKPNPGLGNGFRAQHELAMHFSKGGGKYNTCNYGNIIDCARVHTSDREHQTQKPIEVIQRIIEVVSAPGEIILDPFAGSGTTLVAAKNLGRKSIGVEIDRAYCDIIVNRLRQEVLPI